jgi:hypothetical protein
LVWALGVFLALGPNVYLVLGKLPHDAPRWLLPTLVGTILPGAVIAQAGLRLRLTGRRHLTRIAAPPAAEEPFVLYLRAFDQDSDRGRLERPLIPAEIVQPVTFLAPLFLSGKTMEEQLIAVVRGLGRVIAVGRPGESRPPAGAQRLYLAKRDWQRPVREMMSQARLVVLVLDATPGTVWEFNQALKLVEPRRLLLVAPADQQRYETFRGRVAPAQLPDFRAPARMGNEGRRNAISGLIHYSADWTPTFTPLSTFMFYDVLRAAVRLAADPALNQLRAYEETLPLDPIRQVRRGRARILRVVGHLTCLYGFTSAWFGVGIRHWHLTDHRDWSGVVFGVVAFALGLFELYVSRDFRRRSAPLPTTRP